MHKCKCLVQDGLCWVLLKKWGFIWSVQRHNSYVRHVSECVRLAFYFQLSMNRVLIMSIGLCLCLSISKRHPSWTFQPFKAESDMCVGLRVCVCACIWMYVYNLTDPDSCLIVDGFFPPNTGSVWKPPPPFPASHAAAFLTLLPCFPFSLHTSAIFHFPLWEIVCVCVCVCVWVSEADTGSGCSGSLPRSKRHLSLTLS